MFELLQAKNKYKQFYKQWNTRLIKLWSKFSVFNIYSYNITLDFCPAYLAVLGSNFSNTT